jgi:hypothetical protein
MDIARLLASHHVVRKIGWLDSYRVKWLLRNVFEPDVEIMVLILILIECLKKPARVVVKYLLNWNSVGCSLPALVAGKFIFGPELIHDGGMSEASLGVCRLPIDPLNSVQDTLEGSLICAGYEGRDLTHARGV